MRKHAWSDISHYKKETMAHALCFMLQLSFHHNGSTTPPWSNDVNVLLGSVHNIELNIQSIKQTL